MSRNGLRQEGRKQLSGEPACRYRTNITKEQLDRAPKYSESTSWNWSRENDQRVYDYYRARPYWE